tara:strand:- start:2518 stop:2649 length:132 start_codon:yes stop_codon:yes gene_type:complete
MAEKSPTDLRFIQLPRHSERAIKNRIDFFPEREVFIAYYFKNG